MKIKAIHFKLEGQTAEPSREDVSLDSAQDIFRLKEENPRSTFVIVTDHQKIIPEKPGIKVQGHRLRVSKRQLGACPIYVVSARCTGHRGKI